MLIEKSFGKKLISGTNNQLKFENKSEMDVFFKSCELTILKTILK
jgi:hypothetical protein